MSYNVPIKVLDSFLRLRPQAAAYLLAISAALVMWEASWLGALVLAALQFLRWTGVIEWAGLVAPGLVPQVSATLVEAPDPAAAEDVNGLGSAFL